MADDDQIQGDIQVSGINDPAPATGSSGGQSGSNQGAGTTTGGQGDQSDQKAQPVAKPAAPPTAKKPISLEDKAMAESSAMAAKKDKYSVPDMVKEKFPDLLELIKTTESMNDEERDYWFQILPIMTEDQIARFREILINEQQQLAKLDKDYEQQITQLNEKHMLEWKEFETKEKRKAIATAEASAEESEAVKEKELLERLANI